MNPIYLFNTFNNFLDSKFYRHLLSHNVWNNFIKFYDSILIKYHRFFQLNLLMDNLSCMDRLGYRIILVLNSNNLFIEWYLNNLFNNFLNFFIHNMMFWNWYLLYDFLTNNIWFLNCNLF